MEWNNRLQIWQKCCVPSLKRTDLPFAHPLGFPFGSASPHAKVARLHLSAGTGHALKPWLVPHSLCHCWHRSCHGFNPQETALSQEMLYDGIGQPLFPEIWERKTYLRQGRDKGKEESSGVWMQSKPCCWVSMLQNGAGMFQWAVQMWPNWPRARGWREAGTPGQSCCRAPAASWHFAVCKWNWSSCWRAGIPHAMAFSLRSRSAMVLVWRSEVCMRGWRSFSESIFLLPTFLLSQC